jgi:hypothetical protein
VKKAALLAFVLLSVAPLFAQGNRWAYTYNGPAGLWDQAWRAVVRPDTTVYVCGDAQQNQIPLTLDMTIVGLTAAGMQRWVYNYGGPGFLADQALDMIAPADGNLYVCGASYDLTTGDDFTILSLTDSGPKRWVYRYATPGIDVAKAVTMTVDGYVCAAGYTEDEMYFTVLSMLPCGHENWVYRMARGGAQAILAGPDTTVYAAGYVSDSATGGQADIGVVCLWKDGTRKWLYTYDGPGHAGDTAWAMRLSDNGKLYVVGHSNGGATGTDLVVICLNAADGNEEWVYRRDGGSNGFDLGTSIACGPHGEIYAGGMTMADSGFSFTVVSLTAQGGEDWVFRDTGGHAQALNIAAALVCDDSGNVYAGGEIAGTESTYTDATVISLARDGAKRWRYDYAGPGRFRDNFGSLARGPDGNIYACGTTGEPPNCDWVVVSLTAAGAVAEPQTANGIRHTVSATTVFRDNIVVNLNRPPAPTLRFRLCDVAGRVVVAGRASASGGRVVLRDPGLARLGTGCYFLTLEPVGVQFKLVKIE